MKKKIVNKIMTAVIMPVLTCMALSLSKTTVLHAEDASYTVTIPTAITYSNMDVGHVDVSSDYTVNVHGNLDASKAVKVTATANPLTAAGERLTVL